MPDLGAVQWPPDPIRTERLCLRPARSTDRPHFIELLSSAEVQRYVGGPKPRDVLETSVPEVPFGRPGVFAVERAAEFVGTVTLERPDPQDAAAARPAGAGIDIGYLFLPAAWGHGYATEAVGAALDWLASVLPNEGVVLCTQVANTASLRLGERLGFAEVTRFEGWEAEQWMGVRFPGQEGRGLA